MPKFDDSTIARNLAIAAEYFKAYYPIAYKEKKFSGGTTGFIPFNIEFTIDGLSGIKIYNKLRVDTSFLPAGYTKTLDFIVTGIEHKLKDGDWETVIKTTMIPKLSATEVVVTSANFKYIAYKDPVKEEKKENIVVDGIVTPINLDPQEGPSDGVYISPPRKADSADGTNYVDVTLTVDSTSLKKIAGLNGGIYPIIFYTKPGDSSGTKYAKVVGYNGARNLYEGNPKYSSSLVKWVYKGITGYSRTAYINKLWGNTMTQMAAHLDSKGMWNSNYIKQWDPSPIKRDVTPGKTSTYGLLTAHAFSMAIDINSARYPVAEVGVANYIADLANPSAEHHLQSLVIYEMLENFVKIKGGEQNVYHPNANDQHHFSVFIPV